jgi:hypothetical protein
MSGESARHRFLVERLLDTVEIRHQGVRSVVIFADHHRFGSQLPPTIGDFTPDVLVTTVPATFRLIGEAKTRDDIETERSQRQLTAFLDHLSLHPPSSLWLAVPFDLAPRARVLIRSMRRAEHKDVNVEILPFV